MTRLRMKQERPNLLLNQIPFQKILLQYSLVFSVVAVLSYYPFWSDGKSFIWEFDGIDQHFVALIYIGRWIRTVLGNLFVRHTLEIPIWDFAIGQGEDILTTLQYYGLGDPLVMLTAGFVPEEHAATLYNALVIIRLYLAGLFFVCHCRYMKLDRWGSLAGSLAYVFCGYALYSGVRHPFFLTPMVYFPLLIFGSEKLLRNENPAVLIISLFLTTISNYYFAYMQCLLVMVYVAIRYFAIADQKHARALFRCVVRFTVAGLTGLAMAAVTLLPVVHCFLSDSRVQANHSIALFQPWSFYGKYLAGFMGNKAIADWTRLGYGPLVFLALCLLFLRRRKQTWLKALVVVLFVFQMIPFFGYILNGFSYVSNRWCWAFAFVVAYVLALMWPSLRDLTTRERRALSIVSIGYVVLCFLVSREIWIDSLAQQAVLAAALLILCAPPHFLGIPVRRFRTAGMMVICIASVVLNANDLFSEYSREFLDSKTVYAQVSDTASGKAMRELEKEPFGRFTIKYARNNESLMSGAHGISSYWSLHGNRIGEYRRDMELPDSMGFSWSSFQGRAFLDSLNNVKYWLYGEHQSADSKGYGKRKVIDMTGCSLYEYDYALPIGYTYRAVLTREQYDLLTAVQKQEALIQNVLIDGETRHSYAENDYETTSWDVPYAIEKPQADCVVEENALCVQAKNTSLTLRFDPQAECELYLHLRGFCAESTSGKDTMKIIVSDGRRNITIDYNTPEAQFYFGAHDFLINLGYFKGDRDAITITFKSPGRYTFDAMRMVCQSMDGLPGYVQARSQDALEQVEFGVNRMTGRIDAEENEILCLAVPYSTGWKAYVDGVETPVHRANIWCMAVELEPGRHSIEIRYETPWGRMGIGLTAIGLLAFMAIEYEYGKRSVVRNSTKA